VWTSFWTELGRVSCWWTFAPFPLKQYSHCCRRSHFALIDEGQRELLCRMKAKLLRCCDGGTIQCRLRFLVSMEDSEWVWRSKLLTSKNYCVKQNELGVFEVVWSISRTCEGQEGQRIAFWIQYYSLEVRCAWRLMACAMRWYCGEGALSYFGVRCLTLERIPWVELGIGVKHVAFLELSSEWHPSSWARDGGWTRGTLEFSLGWRVLPMWVCYLWPIRMGPDRLPSSVVD